MITWLLSTIAICGVIGGIIGYIEELNSGNNGGIWYFLKYLLLGLSASFVVPLFLNTISSTLIKDVLNTGSPGSIVSLLVVAGFCLIASISSRRFIERITDKVLQQVNQAVEAANSAEKKADTAVLKAVTVRKDDVPAADQAASTNLAGLMPISGGGGLIQTTSG